MFAIKFRTPKYVNAYFDMRYDFRDSLGHRRAVACSAISNRLDWTGGGEEEDRISMTLYRKFYFKINQITNE